MYRYLVLLAYSAESSSNPLVLRGAAPTGCMRRIFRILNFAAELYVPQYANQQVQAKRRSLQSLSRSHEVGQSRPTTAKRPPQK
ncbi:hypothetical protein N7478_009758 [Penicillium angulare]|uniref:uncharacterized protein n=1 Tax=Penicillium angulare TaxID=116970 RepID=UPI00253F653F|nr:uncharacterized protein N7478_009758 [Penicillium angulare]KAJ5266950.1 hypothetical protein N7478_009758 [Penicillium angulare]